MAERRQPSGTQSSLLDSELSENGRRGEEGTWEPTAVVEEISKQTSVSTDESGESDSDGSLDGVTVPRRKQNVVRQVISAGRDDSDIEVKGQFMERSPISTPPHGMGTAVGKSKRKEESSFEDTSFLSMPTTPQLSKTNREEGERGERELNNADEPPIGFQKIRLQMKKRAHSGLGVTIIQSLGATKGLFMVRRIMAGGVAARDKRVRTGDRLVAINDKTLFNLSHAEVLQTINEAPKEVQLELWRDPEFDLDATSSVYSIGSRSNISGSRSSIISDDDTEDSLSKRHSSISLERFAREGGRTRGSPNVARYSTSMADHLSFGHAASPGTPKRWSAIVLSPNVGPAGEILSIPSPPPTSPTLTELPVNPAPSPNTLTPSPVPHSLSPTPEPTSPLHQGTPSQPPSPPPSTPPLFPTQAQDYTSDSDGSQTPPPPLPPSQPPITGEDSDTRNSFRIERGNETHDREQQSGEQQLRDEGTARRGHSEVERPKSLGPIPKGSRLEHRPFEIEITKGIFGLGLTLGMGNTGMVVVKALTSRSPITKDGNIRYDIISVSESDIECEQLAVCIKYTVSSDKDYCETSHRVGDQLLSINDTSLIGVDLTVAEVAVKALSRGVVRFAAMAPPKDVTGSGLKGGATLGHQPQDAPSSHLPPISSSPPPPPASPLPEIIDEPGIIRAKVTDHTEKIIIGSV